MRTHVMESARGSRGWRERRPSKRALVVLGALAVATLAGMAGGDAHAGRPPVAAVAAPSVAVRAGAAERLAGALRIPTVSSADSAVFDTAAFGAMHGYLQSTFPRLHVELRREVVARHSLLYTWGGSDPSLAPILLTGHLDVVPVEPGTEGEWQHEPFGGHIADGFVWGRGAIDDKSSVVGTMEAIEMLLESGYRPERTVLLAFGHDEEVGGTRGAREIAELLQRREIRPAMVLDEGGVIGDGILPGVDAPTALVGIAEKGFVSVELSTRTAGGHSSLPPRQGAVGILSGAITRLEDNPMPARLEGPTQQLFEHLAPSFPLAKRALLGNLWATRPLVLRSLEGNPTTNAMVRTTTAVTIFQAGTKENVLPSQARAVANVRILPGDSVADVLAHVRRVVDDPRVSVAAAAGFTAEPSPVSRTDTESFQALARAIHRVTPDAVVAPYLVVVVTDARYYAALSPNVFRFLPLRLVPSDLARMHGTNERVAVREYEGAIRFYRELILETAGR